MAKWTSKATLEEIYEAITDYSDREIVAVLIDNLTKKEGIKLLNKLGRSWGKR